MHSLNFLRDVPANVTLVARLLLSMYSERVFICEHYFASRSLAAVHEAFSIAYPAKEVPNKTTVLMLLARFM
jgi:hypothetical protein